ncbi:MAG: type II 3-dehydroquinate dehydratase [Bacteroidia bacterium]
MKVLILSGPNLNMLGRREPSVYGAETLDDILAGLRAAFPHHDIGHYQSNVEGELVTRIQQTLAEDWDGLVVNLGAYTHYSYVLLDALRMVQVPKVEVHVSHIFAREAFRQTSVIAPACDGMISGLGKDGYLLALTWLERHTR